jgi:hypothetical protein
MHYQQGKESTQFIHLGGVLHQWGGQIKRNAFVQEELAFMQSELFLSPAF